MRENFQQQLVQLPCFMHTSVHLEKRLMENAPDIFKQVLHHTKILFGSRCTMGFQPNSLRTHLAHIIGGSKKNYFLTDIGESYF